MYACNFGSRPSPLHARFNFAGEGNVKNGLPSFAKLKRARNGEGLEPRLHVCVYLTGGTHIDCHCFSFTYSHNNVYTHI